MSSYSSQLERLVEELGGCGLMQKLLCIIIHFSSIVSLWSLLAMSFIGYNPGFNCHTLEVKQYLLSTLNLTDLSSTRMCSVGPNTTCTSYIFPENLNTAVSEWNLVCEKRWTVAFITSIQMIGVVTGSIVAGQAADSTGRKPAMIAGVSIMGLFNFIGYFAKSWKVYSMIRFFIGFGFGLIYTVQYTQMIEFVPSPWRSFVVCFPSIPFISMLFALVSWWLHDWKRLHLLKTCISIFSLIFLCFVPESFRWLIAKRKFERAEKLINFVANVNRVPKPDLKSLFAMKETITTSKPTAGYTIFTLWSSKELRIVTLSLSAVWFAISITWYSIALGMESISVDIFWTMFLINLVDVPAFSVTGPLLNRFGRRKYCFVTFAASSILCCVSGVFQHFDKLSQNSASLTVTALVLSLFAKMTVTAADTAVIVYTAELYPTDVRTTGCGFQGTVGRLGAIAAPLLVHLDGIYPGSMYFTCGMLLLLSTGSILRLKETKDDILQDSVINTLDPGDG